MSLRKTLLGDLGRLYAISGMPDRKPSLFRLLLSFFSPRFMPVVLFRVSHSCYEIRLLPLAKMFSMVNFVVFGLEVAARCKIGKGLYLPHTQGTVIGAASIGENATIYHNVTIGAREIDIGYSEAARPTLGNNVIVGSGAKVLGGVTVGDFARVGANAVVVHDVEPGNTVVGIPAQAVKRDDIVPLS